jgi:hypothetical protein
MDNLYVIQIGRITKKGNMDVYVTKYISTQQTNVCDIRDYFQNKYDGFSIVVCNVEKIEDVNIEKQDMPF